MGRLLRAFCLLIFTLPLVPQEGSDAAFREAQAALKEGKYEQALVLFTAVLRRQPDHLDAALGAGRCLVALGRLAEAVGRLETLRERMPEEARVHALLGEAYYWHALQVQREPGFRGPGFAALRMADAVRALERAVELDPGAHVAHYYLGLARLRLEPPDREGAEKALRRAVALAPAQASYHFELAKLLQGRRAWAEAAAEFLAAARRSPSGFEAFAAGAFREAGLALARRKRWAEAAQAFLEAFRRTPEDGALYQALWAAYAGDPQGLARGRKLLRRCLDLRPGSAMALYYLGHFEYAAGNREQALRHFRAAVRRPAGKKFAAAWAMVGELLLTVKKDEEGARKALLAALRLNPNDERAVRFLQFLVSRARERGQLEAAEKLTRKILQYRPEDARQWSNLGYFLQAQRRLKEAWGAYEKALALAPKNPDIKVDAGNCLNDLGRLKEAEALFQEALRLKPDHLWGLKNLAWLYRKMGRLEEAKALFERILKLAPGDRGIRRDLEDVERRLKG